LGEAQVWPAAVVSDAQFALRRREERPATPADRFPRVTVKARKAVVRAVCQAADTGDIFLGFESGEVKFLQPPTGAVNLVIDEGRPILSLAVTPAGDAVALISERGQGRYFLKTQVKNTMYREASRLALAEDEELRLCPNLVGDADRFLGAV